MNSRAEILRVQHFYPWFSEMSVDIRHWQCWFEMMVAGALSLFHYGIAVVVGIVVAFHKLHRYEIVISVNNEWDNDVR